MISHNNQPMFGIKQRFILIAICTIFSAAASWGQSGQSKRTSPGISQPYTWRNVQIVAGGFVDGLVFHPTAKDVLYARTDIGGAYRWDAKARRWMPLLDWLGPTDWNLTGVESIGLDPTDANRVYLAVGTYTSDWAGNGAILRSFDQGRTWRRADLPFKNGGNMDGRSAGERLAVDPNQNRILYFGSRDNGLWRSADAGATWAQVENFPVTGRTNGVGVVFVVFDKDSGERGKATPTLYAGVSQNGPSLYRSKDQGATWQAVQGQPVSLLPHHALLTADGSLYLTYGNAPGPNGMSGGAVWKYDTHAATWADITPLKGGFGYAGLAADAKRSKTVMVSTMDRWNPGDTLFRSRDGGKTWNDLGPKTVRDWSLAPYMTFGGSSARLGWWIGALALDPFRPGHALYGTGATIWASEDVTQADVGGPTHWTVGADGLEETAVIDLISPTAGAPLISALGDIGGFRHDSLTVSPAGGMWKNPPMTNTDSLDFAETDPAVVVRVGRGGRGQSGGYSTDGGVTWTPFPTEPAGSRGSGTAAVSADGAAMLWAPQGAAPAITRDYGTTWTVCAGLPQEVRVISDRVNPRRFYAVNARTGMFYASTDGGLTFTTEAQPVLQGAGRLSAVPGHEGDLWLSAGGTLYHSTDGGVNFARLSTATAARGVGFGKAAPGLSYPALYLLGTVGAPGIFRSDDEAKTWIRLNDAQHQYATADIIIGDPRVYGRVYVGTNGRGILYGDPVQKSASAQVGGNWPALTLTKDGVAE